MLSRYESIVGYKRKLSDNGDNLVSILVIKIVRLGTYGNIVCLTEKYQACMPTKK